MNTKMPIIMSACVRLTLRGKPYCFAAKTHGECERRAHFLLKDLEPPKGAVFDAEMRTMEHGFLDSDGRFLTKEEAFDLARENGQAKAVEHSLTMETLYQQEALS